MYLQTIIMALSAAGHVFAVDITLVGNTEPAQRCGKLTNPYGTCSGIAIATCCIDNDLTAYSVAGDGLYTGGVPDQLVAYGFGGCDKSCNSGGGANYECVDCTGGSEIIGGAAWYRFGGLAEQKAIRSVKPDVIGLYDFSIGRHREFRVDDSVPADIVAEIKQGFRNGTHAEDLSPAVRHFEIPSKA